MEVFNKNHKNDRGSAGMLRRFFRFPDTVTGMIAMIVLLLAESVFILFLSALDILPGKFMVAVIILLLIADVAVLLLINRKRRRRSVPAGGLILTAILLIIMNLAGFYLYSTYDTFSKISGHLVQTETFYVIVLKDGSYEKAEDIAGKTVHVSKAETRTYKEAKGKLVTKEDVVYEEEEDLVTTGHVLIDRAGQEHDEIIFVSRNNYQMICEEIDGFRKNTKIIYKVPVEVKSDNNSKKVNVTEDSFNIYITGIDVFGNIDQVSRSDVNMIITVNPKTKTILLTSIPRDTYIPLHSFGALDKLTHSGIYGVDETVDTVEDWLDIEINYYVRINFSMLIRIVDAIGGVDVDSPYAFKSAVSDYTYKKGMNHLDGKAALYFARERKSFKDEDEQRIRNQQIVLKAMIEKITGSTALLTGYTKILDAVEGKLQTDLSDRDISSLVKMQLDDLGKWKIRTVSVTGEGAYEYTYSMGQRELFVSIPDENSVKKAKEEINSVMYPVE